MTLSYPNERIYNNIIMENLKPNRQRAKNAITLIWIVLALEIVSLISGYLQYDLLQTPANGGEITMEAATANDNREKIVGAVYLIVLIISAVTFIQWFRRAYFNLHTRVNHLSHSDGWAAGSWFVPVINLYRPYQIMKELYQETKKLLLTKLNINEKLSTSSLVWWWTLWIISIVMGQFLLRYGRNAESIDELTISTVVSMMGNILGIPLALFAVKVIKDYSSIEPLLLEIKDEEETNW